MPEISAPPQKTPPAESSHTIHRQVLDGGVCVLTFDRPGSSANIFDRATLAELGQELDFIESAPQLKGVIFASAKRSIFLAGLDLKTVDENMPPDAVREIIGCGQALFSRIAALKIPTVAAIHGAALGGGCELALACDYRLASPDRVTKIGLPETKLGLLPAWGGATRLPRLIGLPKALDFILAGKVVASRQALKLEMIDEIAPAEYLIAVARKKISQGKISRPGHWLVNNPVVVAAIAARTRPRLLKKTRGHYPAVLKAFEVMTAGLRQSIDKSLALEREGVMELVQNEACRNLLRVFFLQERAKKSSPVKMETRPVARTAVIGAGVMGAGIAQWLSAKNVPVILRDINPEQIGRGLDNIARIYHEGIRHHAFTPREARAGFDKIFPAATEVPLRHVDLVIEAAVENLELKRKIFTRLEALAGEETILATNTSSLPVSEVAAGTRRPDRVIGLHFFNPVHRMQLVEIIVATHTAPEVLQRTVKFAQHIGKLPVVVRDSPGFLVNRILMPYLVEAGNLFENGAGPETLDSVMLDFGMPMGPLRLMDEVGLDVALHVAGTLAVKFGDRMKIPGCLPGMVGAGLLGRKVGRGFLLHGKPKGTPLNPQALTFVRGDSARALSREELQERMVFLMINEAAGVLEERIVTEPADVDFAMIMGTGFAPFRGGPLRYADAIGIDKIVGAMENLVDRGAAHFEPCPLLKAMSGTGKRFYPGK
ncbi:MAG TPA: 3-hydroxyacyl-CoA dehydrogenase NAD-binding domain-containing protein [Candidatus Angelobacter sp.]|nr:3-hydroxyacyl-CoA dehydrogenase NAD-binding domain-containing protein [Candidatus Angelobacter sp.]